MRWSSPRAAVAPLLLLLALPLLGACERARAPSREPAAHVVPEHQRASEAIGKQIPTGAAALPGHSGVQGIQKALQAGEAAQDRYDRRADQAARGD